MPPPACLLPLSCQSGGRLFRDKRKKKTGKKPGGGADKTERKTERNEEKKSRRAERAAAGGEDDIDALLAQFKLEDQAHTRVEVQEECAPPSPRVYASFTPLPSQARPAPSGLLGGRSRRCTVAAGAPII